MSASMQIALVLTAINNMGGALRSARQQVSDLGHTYDSLQKKLQTANELRTSGLENVAAGAAMLTPIEAAVQAAGDLEYAMKKLEISAYDSSQSVAEQKKQLAELKKQAVEYGAATAFSSTQVANGMNELIRSGMSVQDVLNGGAKAATYLAQTAEVAPEMAAQSIAKISNTFNIAGSQLMQVADDINRASNASSAGIEEIMYSMQLAGASAASLGLTAKETSLLIGTLYNKGLGTQSGSSLNNLLLALTNVKDQAGEAMARLGMLKNATFEKQKNGTWKIIGGEGSVFNEKGQIRSAQALVDTVRAAFHSRGLSLKDIVDKKGNLLPEEQLNKLGQGKAKLNEIILLFKQAFGEEGMRAAIALAAEGKGSYEATAAAAKRAMDIQEQVTQLQGTMLGLFEQLKGAWDTFNAQTGGVVIDEVKKLVKEGLSYLDVMSKWVKENPELTRQIIRTIAAIAFFSMGLGAAKVVLGLVMSPLLSIGMGFVRFANYASGAARAFVFFRAMGNGVVGAGLKALFKDFPMIQQLIQRTANFFSAFGRASLRALAMVLDGIMNGIAAVGRFAIQGAAWLGRLGLSFLRLSAQALLMGARIALAWIIGLGPVGWIIAGVTAIITIAIIAWRTNFMGFRDRVREVWNSIRNGAASAWRGITETINSFFSWLGTLPELARKWGSNLMEMFAAGIRNGAGLIRDAVNSAAGWIADFLGFSSPTKKGPASKSDRWAPNFMNMFADGIYAGIPAIDKSTKAVVGKVRSNMGFLSFKPSVSAAAVAVPNRLSDDENSKRYVARSHLSTHTVQDNRKIEITIFARDAQEAEVGVRRAVDEKYIASRGKRTTVWQRG